MRYTGVFGRTALVLVAVITAVTLLASPARAAVVTTTQTFVNRFGNTVTITTTWTDGVLSSQTYDEVSPAGLVVLSRDISYWPNGTVSHYEEVRTSSGGAFQSTLIQDRDQNGFIREQYVKLVSNGETIAEQFTSYDAGGYLIYQEDRILTTLADGTREWLVTIDPDGAGVLASYTKTYPYGYDFNATLPERPGYGYGDANHEHSGPPGQADGSSAGGDNGSGASDAPESRPGYGHGDENHDHTRGRSQEFVK